MKPLELSSWPECGLVLQLPPQSNLPSAKIKSQAQWRTYQ